MPFFRIEPEVAGELGERTAGHLGIRPHQPPRLHYEFHDWLGGDILAAVGTIIVTTRLKERIRQEGFGGCAFDRVEVTRDDQFDELTGSIVLPEFVWLKITGVAEHDDFGLAADLSLVVSERVLQCLREFNLSVAVIERYERP